MWHKQNQPEAVIHSVDIRKCPLWEVAYMPAIRTVLSFAGTTQKTLAWANTIMCKKEELGELANWHKEPLYKY